MDNLPYEPWKESKTTLHLMLQVVGKVRLALHPRLNHWWHVPFYVSSRGLTTGSIPNLNRIIDLEFDLLEHRLRLRSSDGFDGFVDLVHGSISDFYSNVVRLLTDAQVDVAIQPYPFDESKVESDIPFPEDTSPRAYDREAVTRFWRVLTEIEPIFEEFRGRFLGKSTPVHLFWHSFDLALTRFSGKPAPEMPQVDPVTRDAYSHEVVSFGFWPGDSTIPEPAFYSYAAPEPLGLETRALEPPTAWWQTVNGGHLALLRYDDVRTSPSPRGSLLSFLESAYRAGAAAAGWDIDQFRYAPAYPTQ